MYDVYDVFASVRTNANRVGDECECVRKATYAAGRPEAPCGWDEYIRRLDWFLTYYGRIHTLED